MYAMIFLIATLPVSTEPDRWPGFLGVGATPIDPVTIPLKWSPIENIAWKTKLAGRGQSSPVIWGQRVFVTAIEGPMKDKCQIFALALSDGRILWQREFPASQKVRSNYFQSRAAPTPVVDRNGIYVFFETGDVVALTHDGQQRWRRELTKDYGEFETNIGLAASPVQTDTAVILLIDHEGPSYVIAVDKQTGKTLWKTDRTSRVSYASPALVPVGDALHLVCSSAGSVDGYDPATGKRLWSMEEVGGNTVTTPLPFGNGRFLVGASPGMHNEREKEARQSNLAMHLEPHKDGFMPKVSWRTTEAMPTFGSPIVYRDHAYWVNRVGIVYCFEAATGKLCYSRRIRQMCWASPVGIGERVYFFGKDGLTTVLAAGPEFRLLAENHLWEAQSTSSDKASSDPAGEHGREHVSPQNAQPPAVQSDAPRTSSGRNRPETGPGGLNFADPVQYGVAVVNGSLIIRTGGVVYCVRAQR